MVPAALCMSWTPPLIAISGSPQQPRQLVHGSELVRTCDGGLLQADDNTGSGAHDQGGPGGGSSTQQPGKTTASSLLAVATANVWPKTELMLQSLTANRDATELLVSVLAMQPWRAALFYCCAASMCHGLSP